MSDERLCPACHRIWVTEGMIPAYCSACSPPRYTDEALATVPYAMLKRENHDDR